MPITKYNTENIGQNGVEPRRVTITSTDNYATVTAAGYVTQAQQASLQLTPSDEVLMYYGNTTGSNGSLGIFNPVFSDGIITLKDSSFTSSVTLPVVSGDFASFDGTTGKIKDAYAPSDDTKTIVAMADSVITSGNVAAFIDNVGTVGNGGIAATNIQNKTNIKAGILTQSSATNPQAFTIAGLTTSSVVNPSLSESSLGKVITGFEVTANTLTVGFSDSPGDVIIHYSAFIAAQ